MPQEPFRLDQVLELKRRREEQKQLELKARMEQEQHVLSGLRALEARIEAHMRDTDERRRGGRVNAQELAASMEYLERLEAQRERQRVLLEETSKRVAECRAELVTALQERRTLETLRAKRLAEARLEEGRREAREVDDVTSARYTRAKLQAADGGPK